jgi:hypothetical protein
MSLRLRLCGSLAFFLGTFGSALLLCLVAASPTATAQSALSTPQTFALENSLEGVRFVGPFGAEAESNPKQDTFTFKDGKFATGSCLEWGFTPAPYWLRRGADGLHFLAELESPEHGTMRYEGVFDGQKLTVTGYWKKERWYWTVERTYRGWGRPAAPSE